MLTPGMMSLGVPGLVAVASNICHKFPKALVGAIKRNKYGHVDVKLGLILGLSAEGGMLYGAGVQQGIKERLGDAGSNLYVSAAFVIVLAIVGTWVMVDAWNLHRRGTAGHEEQTTRLARWVHNVRSLGPRFYSQGAKAHIPWLITLPIGFATGMLAATIAVGGFGEEPDRHAFFTGCRLQQCHVGGRDRLAVIGRARRLAQRDRLIEVLRARLR